MAKIVQRNEILFRAPTRVGLLADVTERLFAKGVNVLGIRAYEEDGTGVFLIFTDDSRSAAQAIETLGEGVVSSIPVIAALLPNEPGQLAAVARALANADINITQVHATTTDAPTAEVVLSTSDNIRAMDALQQL
ncbi:MAG TPA: ACT domain-containing protein [Coriobacteriia bacterium]